jgi:hypothetical protein
MRGDTEGVFEQDTTKHQMRDDAGCEMKTYFELDESVFYGHGPVLLQYYWTRGDTEGVFERDTTKHQMRDDAGCEMKTYFELDESVFYGHGPVLLQYY